MRKRDLYSGLFFFLIGVLFIIGSLLYPVWDRYGPGPGFFPLVLGIIFSALSFLLFVLAGVLGRGKEETLAEVESLEVSVINRTIIYSCLLLFFYLLFDGLGSLLTVFLFLLGVLILFSKKPMKLSLSISIVTSLLIYVVFIKLLGVPLPGGILQNLFTFY